MASYSVRQGFRVGSVEVAFLWLRDLVGARCGSGIYCAMNRDFTVDDSRSEHRTYFQLGAGLMCSGEIMAMKEVFTFRSLSIRTVKATGT